MIRFRRTAGILALFGALFAGCDQDRRLESPTVRPPLEGSLEIVPLEGHLVTTVPLSGLASGHAIDLEKGVSPSPSALVWHRIGEKETLLEVAWARPKHGTDGDRYEFQLRRYNADNEPTVTQRKVLYQGERHPVYAGGPHQLVIEPALLTEEEEPNPPR